MEIFIMKDVSWMMWKTHKISTLIKKFIFYKLLTGSYFPYDNVPPTLNPINHITPRTIWKSNPYFYTKRYDVDWVWGQKPKTTR